jgi:mono/diheme cytochrome c family protein
MKAFPLLGVFVIASFLYVPAGFAKSRSNGNSLVISTLAGASQGNSQSKPAETTPAAKPAASDTDGKNPLKATPENVAEAKKLFGYDCAMCHGAAGDGKGDLAASTGMKVNDWRDSSKLEALSDHEIFEIIMKGPNGRGSGSLSSRNRLGTGELCAYLRQEGHCRCP